ncbi:DUF4019 domain-containing protein [Pseudoxanthomonas sp. z9]|uniref:DUF4019 domain-containing protein n=1 Tax=Pseudoxanthomonas sp. z9 TaxID=2584942 RepID=UPI001142D899|nr:DUF4019 domain-containing protein [Pseudoxanthomonas sp. z9]
MGRIALFALLVLLAGCRVSFTPSQEDKLPASTAGTAEEQEAARKAAEGYLALIDSQQYQKTWEDAGPALKDMTSEFVWVNTLKLTRKIVLPEGRKLQGFGFSTRVDARVPEGEYVVVQYLRRADGATGTEKVVMQRHEGRWMIIGYFVHKQVNFSADAD